MKPFTPMDSARLLLAVAIFLIAAACAHTDSFRDRLSVGYGAANAVVDGTMAALQAKKLSPDDAENVIKQADTFKAALDITRKLEVVDPKAADAKLQATTAGLKALQAYLASRERP